MVSSFHNALWRFLLLYGALYLGFGVQSPYLPSLLDSRDLPAEAIAMVLAAGTAIRLAAAPIAGRLADWFEAPRAVLILCSATAALIALGYLPARGFWLLFLVGVLHSAALAPLAPLSDTLALGSAAPARSNIPGAHGFHYGWLRGAGSAAFIFGTVLSGRASAIWDRHSSLAQCRAARRDRVCRPICSSLAASAGGGPAGNDQNRGQRIGSVAAAAALSPHRPGCGIDPR
jgi:MFS transporter, PPP family, 3-phenylpropionic acid transporter